MVKLVSHDMKRSRDEVEEKSASLSISTRNHVTFSSLKIFPLHISVLVNGRGPCGLTKQVTPYLFNDREQRFKPVAYFVWCNS